MQTVPSLEDLKSEAKAKLKGNWFTAILIWFIFAVISAIVGLVPRIGGIIQFIIAGPLALGFSTCFIKLIRNKDFILEDLFDGFSNFKPACIAGILRSLFILLWGLLLIIPGFIAYYKYSMTFYILHDNPELSGKEAIDRSKELMDGYKWNLFLIHLYFFVLFFFLSIITLGLAVLWLSPYLKAVEANFYNQITAASSEQIEEQADENLEAELAT